MKILVFSEDHCVMCGRVIPEGRMVCPTCEVKINEIKPPRLPRQSILTQLKRAICGRRHRSHQRWKPHFVISPFDMSLGGE